MLEVSLRFVGHVQKAPSNPIQCTTLYTKQQRAMTAILEKNLHHITNSITHKVSKHESHINGNSINNHTTQIYLCVQPVTCEQHLTILINIHKEDNVFPIISSKDGGFYYNPCLSHWNRSRYIYTILVIKCCH